ncbi:hypothetical protein ABPG74_019198 [Tetrahymena malaccensis]
MSFFKNNKTAIVLGGSALALTAGVVIYLNSKKQEQKGVKEEKSQIKEAVEDDQEEKVKRGVKRPHNQEQVQVQADQEQDLKQQQLQEREQPDFSVKTKTSIASSRVKVQFLSGTDSFDFATIAAILESSLDYIGEEYITYTQKNREERRKARTVDIERYKELVLEYNAQVEKFILTAQDQLLTDINIDKEIYEKSIETLMQTGQYQQLFMVQSAMRQKITDKLPRNNQVSKEKIKEIIQYQLEILNNQKDAFIAIITQLQYLPDIAELIPFVLNTMIQDMIFEKFGIEEEDQVSQMSAQDVIEDPQIHGLLKQIEDSMLNMMQQLGLNYIDEEQELEEIERLREQGQYSEN